MTTGQLTSPTDRRTRLRPPVRKTVLTVHILASVALTGEVWALVALNLYSTVAAGTELAGMAYRLMSVMVFAGGIPLSLLALAAGVILGLGTHWGVVRHGWVLAKLVLLVGVIVVGMVLFRPEAMAAAAADGTLSTGQQRWQVVVVATQLAMLVTATALSVFKPKGRLRWSGAR